MKYVTEMHIEARTEDETEIRIKSIYSRCNRNAY